MKVLVVEDDISSQLALKRLLKLHNFEVETAGTVAEAVDKLKNTLFNWVLLDLMLPDGCGLDIYDKVNPPPCIVCTGASDEQLLSKAEALSTFRVAHKPINIDSLIKQMRAN